MDSGKNKFLYYLPLIIAGILLLLLFAPKELFTDYRTAEQVPVGWRGIWVSNAYDSSTDDIRERFMISDTQVTWLTTNAQFVDMPLKSIRIPSGEKMSIEFQYLPNKHFLVPPEDKWHDMNLMEDDLIKVYCPFCSKAHTFTRDLSED